MKKIGLMLLTLGASTFLLTNTDFKKTQKTKLDSQFICVLKTSELEEPEVVNASQQQFKRELRSALGYDFRITETFSNALNAVVVKANEKDKEIIESLPSIKRVTKNEIYHFGKIDTKSNSDDKVINETATLNAKEIKGDDTRNFSAETMRVPKSSNQGEGVLVAVLDSGFLLNHNAFAGLPSGTKPKVTQEDIKAVFNSKDPQKQMKAKYIEGIVEEEGTAEYPQYDKETGSIIRDEITGEAIYKTTPVLKEGDHNTYYNSKIAFQYDYSGSIYTHVEDQRQTYWIKDPEDPNAFIELSEEEFEAYDGADGNAYSPYSDHGTHVAGTIAGHDETTYAPGVYDGIAPKAQLALMKVFTDYVPRDGVDSNPEEGDPQVPGTGASDLHILHALEDCVLLDVDVINMSLGQDLNDFDNKAESFETFKNLKKRGTLVNVSAGNNGRQLFDLMGPYGSHLLQDVETGTMGSYANSEDVMTIGSGNLDIQHFEQAILVDGKYAIRYDDQLTHKKNPKGEHKPLKDLGKDTGKTTYDFVYVPGWGEAKDYTGLDVEGKIAVIDRGGGITFATKIRQAQLHGAVAIVIVNDDISATDFNMRMDISSISDIGRPVVLVLNKDKQYLKNAAVNKLEIIHNRDVDNPNIGQMSEFSTDGATFDLRLKPEIVAPGSVIKGPIPGDVFYEGQMVFKQDKTKYEWMSGTSMSSPNFSGACALLLSEIPEAERREYAKSLPARTMSNADIQESTLSHESEDGKEVIKTKSLFSPRRQGSGFVNVTRARDNKVYLEGGLKGKAKIELFNTASVSKGILDLDFTAYNETGKTLTYTPKVVVMRPDINTYNEHPQDKIEEDPITGEITKKPGVPEFGDWIGRKLQSINDVIIYEKVLDKKVTLTDAKGAQAVNLDPIDLASVAPDQLKAIKDNFPSGTYLEGYVILEPTTDTALIEGAGKVNIPYMGFYGDYYGLEPVEKFDFERKKGEVLGSDLMHTLAKRISKPNAYYGSSITGISSLSLSDNKFYDDMNNMWMNNQSIFEVGHKLEYDEEEKALYAGGKYATDLLYIQMFVNRSINDTWISLFKEGDKNPEHDLARDVFGDNAPRFYTPLYGADTHSIAKSMSTANFLNGVLGHRAYAYVPLDGLEDGAYTLKLKFKLQAATPEGMEDRVTTAHKGGIFEKEVRIIVDNTAPEVHHTEVIDVDGTTYLRVYITEKHIKTIVFNGGYIEASEIGYDAEQGLYYTQAPLSDILNNTDEHKLFVVCEDKAYNQSKFMTNVKDDGTISYFIRGNWMVPGFSHTLKVEEVIRDDTTRYHYTIGLKDNHDVDASASNTNRLRITIDVSEYDLTKDFALYRLDDLTEIPIRITDYTLDKEAKTLTFETKGNKFAIEATRTDAPIDPDKPDVPDVPKADDKSNLGLILGISIPCGVVGISGITALIIFLVKKGKKF